MSVPTNCSKSWNIKVKQACVAISRIEPLTAGEIREKTDILSAPYHSACILKSIVIIIAIVGCRNFTSPFPHFVRSWNRLVNNGNGFLALNRRAPPLPILDLPFFCRLARLPVKRALLLDRLVKKLRTFPCCHYVTISLETICDSSSSYNRTAALKK